MSGYKVVSFFTFLVCLRHFIRSENVYKSSTDRRLETNSDSIPKDRTFHRMDSVDDIHVHRKTTPDEPVILLLMERIQNLEAKFEGMQTLETKFERVCIENRLLRKDINFLRKTVENTCKQKNHRKIKPAIKVLNYEANEGPEKLKKTETSDARLLVNRNLTEQKDQLSNAVNAVNRIRRGTPQVTPGLKPAFYASLSRSLLRDHLALGMTIIFDHVVTNVGSHYDSTSGIFTAPVFGVYVFHNGLETASNTYISSTFVKNGLEIGDVSGPLAQGYNGSGYGSNMIVLQLQIGDRVWMKISQLVDNSVLYGTPRVCFVGFLL